MASDREFTLQRLRGKLERTQRIWGGSPEVISTGSPELDRLFPTGGIPRGGMIEWIASSPACGAGSVALALARQACHQGAPLVVLDAEKRIHPAAMALAGIDLSQVLFVHPEGTRDEAWAAYQALSVPGVGGVLCWSRWLKEKACRHLHWAAVQSGGLALVIRSQAALREPCWGTLRIQVDPIPGEEPCSGRSVRVTILRGRGLSGARSMNLEISDEACVVRLAPALAPATVARHVQPA